MEKTSEIGSELDGDKALATSRKYLMFTSVILLALILTGARVTEANTFLFKLTFTNTTGIQDLLLLSVAFLLIRYYSNASRYHQKIQAGWTSRFMKHHFIYYLCEHSDSETGYLVDLAPNFVGFNDVHFQHSEDESSDWSFHPNLLVNAQFQYNHYTQHGLMNADRAYLFQMNHPIKTMKALGLILKFWLQAQTRYRESLEIYSPYFIAFFAAGLAVYSKLT